MAGLIRCIFGPRLYRIHRQDANDTGRPYKPNILESSGDSIIKVIRICWSLSYFSSPVLLGILYMRNYLNVEGAVNLLKFLFSVSILYSLSHFLRGMGRLTSQEYAEFMKVLNTAQKDWSPENKRRLSRYDFEFWAWPADFKLADITQRGDQSKISSVAAAARLATAAGPSNRQTSTSAAKTLPCRMLSYIVAHTIGRRMIYPGSTSLVNALFSPALIQARGKLFEEKRAIRAKLITEDENQIDSLFIDRRDSGHPNGKTLVVCSEGNAGFYEIGCSVTPIEAGYSVLGWNHPGFSGSTGAPYPDQEHKGVDVVMQYAIHNLGFQPDQIILFAWSIGGYSASYAAMCYPDVKYVVLDATFDDLVPLAVSKMPQILKGIVVSTIRTHLNLNSADFLLKYPGPILLIRRSKDEMITTDLFPTIVSNRGNDLLVKLLQHRYPSLVDDSTLVVLWKWLCVDRIGQLKLLAEEGVDEDMCRATLVSYAAIHSSTFPMLIGKDVTLSLKKQLVLYLASKYMEDYDSTHNTPLPHSYFHKAWTLDDSEM